MRDSSFRMERPRCVCHVQESNGPFAPVKYTSFKAEGAVLSSRLADSVKRGLTLNIVSTAFSSNSKVVLQYIQNESPRFHTFIANRVWALMSR